MGVPWGRCSGHCVGCCVGAVPAELASEGDLLPVTPVSTQVSLLCFGNSEDGGSGAGAASGSRGTGRRMSGH